MIFRPCSSNEEENKAVWAGDPNFVSSGFMKAHNDHMSKAVVVVECAKIYILENYEKVTDWSDLDTDITDSTGKSTRYYYNYKEREIASDKKRKRPDIIDEITKGWHNPVSTLTDVVLDPTDGDFSLTINGKDHMWICASSILDIANYIEDKLAEKSENEKS